MIRQATKYDKNQIIQMMLEFKEESKIQAYTDINNLLYWNKLLILQNGKRTFGQKAAKLK